MYRIYGLHQPTSMLCGMHTNDKQHQQAQHSISSWHQHDTLAPAHPHRGKGDQVNEPSVVSPLASLIAPSPQRGRRVDAVCHRSQRHEAKGHDSFGLALVRGGSQLGKQHGTVGEGLKNGILKSLVGAAVAGKGDGAVEGLHGELEGVVTDGHAGGFGQFGEVDIHDVTAQAVGFLVDHLRIQHVAPLLHNCCVPFDRPQVHEHFVDLLADQGIVLVQPCRIGSGIAGGSGQAGVCVCVCVCYYKDGMIDMINLVDGNPMIDMVHACHRTEMGGRMHIHSARGLVRW